MSVRILRGAQLVGHERLLADESRLAGHADALAMPASEAALSAVLAACAAERLDVTLSSGHTGITGGAVPQGGVAVHCGRMDACLGLFERDGSWFLRCGPGVTLVGLRGALSRKDFGDTTAWSDADRAALARFRSSGVFSFAVDPTETSACLGGMVACNASGARSFRHGAMRRHVEGVRGVLVDGRTFGLMRGQCLTDASGAFVLPLDNGEALAGRIPFHPMPATKNAAGYFLKPGMDLVDLFIGSEGTICAISEVTLRLTPEPPVTAGVVVFLPDEACALRLVRRLRGEGPGAFAHRPLSLEFFGHCALDLLRAHGRGAELPAHFHTALSIEFSGTAGETDAALSALDAELSGMGCDSDATWLAVEAPEHERLKEFRHRVPETVNRLIADRRRSNPGITKLGTDMAVPDAHLESMMRLYRDTLSAEGLEYVIFGHIGDNHVHVNILPRTEAEYRRGKELYGGFARAAVAYGGTISAEHGVGRLKTELLRGMAGDAGIAAMRAVKAVFDPEGRLNRGVLFAPAPVTPSPSD